MMVSHDDGSLIEHHSDYVMHVPPAGRDLLAEFTKKSKVLVLLDDLTVKTNTDDVINLKMLGKFCATPHQTWKSCTKQYM